MLENPITQITGLPKTSFILVSTTTKCILCNKDKEEYKQIGNRPRDGDFGCCFYQPESVSEILKTKVYCARPGLRLWECDMEGNVLKTHQLKIALASLKETKVLEQFTTKSPPNELKTDDNNFNTENNSTFVEPVDHPDIVIADSILNPVVPISKQFSKLLNFNSQSRYIISYLDNNLFIFDAIYSTIAIIISDIVGIISVSLIDESTLIILTKHMKCYYLKFSTIEDHLHELINQQNYMECCELINSHLDYIQNKMKVLPNSLSQLLNLRDILNRLNRFDMLKDMDKLFNNLEYDLKFKPPIKNVGGGILIVNNLKNGKKSMHSQNDEDEYPKICPNDDGIVVKTNQKKIVAKIQSENLFKTEQVSDEKEIWNLFMIFKSALISGTTFTERYKDIFDKYKINEVIKLVTKLQKLMKENDENPETSIQIFFDYLRPEIIYEIDDYSRKFIASSFIEINLRPAQNLTCPKCSFPIIYDEACTYPEIGRTLIQYFWSRSEHDKCFELANQVSYLIRDIAKFYIQDKNYDKLIDFSFVIGDSMLIRRAIASFANETDLKNVEQMWHKAFNMLHAIHSTKKCEYFCLKCQQFIIAATDDLKDYDDNLATKFSWDTFLLICTDFMGGQDLLKLVLEFNELIPNESIGQDFYLKCLLNA